MTATYRILVATKVLEGAIQWPDGLRLTGSPLVLSDDPGMHWHEFEDDHADPSLNGRNVELTLSLVDGKPVITGRAVVA